MWNEKLHQCLWKNQPFFSWFLKKKIKTLLEGGEVFWHGGKTKLVLDDLKYLAEIEKGQQSSGKCDNVKLFRELYPPQKNLLYNFIAISIFQFEYIE